MTGINHKQARRYLRAAADGLLHERQRALLDAHLRGCDSCRAEADMLNALEARLKKNFQARWDAHDGPSTNVMTTIQSRSRRIIMKNRIDMAVKTAAGITALIAFVTLFNFLLGRFQVLSSPAQGGQQGRLIAFSSAQNGNPEIYVMNTDGSGLRNITNDPFVDTNPVWSPDGSRLIFESNRNGNYDIFAVDPGGSGVTQLTHDPADDRLGGFPSAQNFGYRTLETWSPDGKHILFENNANGAWLPYVMNPDGSDVTQLIQDGDAIPGEMAWSPDGGQLAVASVGDAGWGEIMVVNIDGTSSQNVVTGDPLKSNTVWSVGRIVGWSWDEESLYYEYDSGDGDWHILQAAADGSGTAVNILDGHALSSGVFISGWLGSESTLSYITQQAGGQYDFTFHNTYDHGSVSWNDLVLCGYLPPDSSRQPDLGGDSLVEELGASRSGLLGVLGVACPNQGYSELYILDSSSGTIDVIARVPELWDHIKIDWSADDQVVLVQGSINGTTDMYILTAEELQKKTTVHLSAVLSGGFTSAQVQPAPFK